MPATENRNAVSDRALIPGYQFSRSFLAMLGAPEQCIGLDFSVHANGLLKCRATHYTDMVKGVYETATKEWEVQLPRTSPLYRIITGELT